MKNPFSHGTSAEIIELISSVMAHPDNIDEDDREWAFRALDFLESFIPAIVWKRDNQDFYLDAASIYGAMTFKNVIDMANSVAIPHALTQPIKSYLENLHGFHDMTTYDENDENFLVVEQRHGYRTMQMHRPLSYLNGSAPLNFKI